MNFSLAQVANIIANMMNNEYDESSVRNNPRTRAKISSADILDLLYGREREHAKLRAWQFEELRNHLDAHGFGFHEAINRGGYLLIRLSSLEAAPVLRIPGASSNEATSN